MPRPVRAPSTRWLLALWLFQVAYTLSPVDVIPDFLPVLGWLDDLAVWSIVLVLTAWAVREVVTSGPRLAREGWKVAHDLEARGMRVQDAGERVPYEPMAPEEIAAL